MDPVQTYVLSERMVEALEAAQPAAPLPNGPTRAALIRRGLVRPMSAAANAGCLTAGGVEARQALLDGAAAEPAPQGILAQVRQALQPEVVTVAEVDVVNHPPHYRHPSGVECIAITEHMTFLRGNAMKYLWRAGSKGDAVQELEDLRKAQWYLAREIGNLSSQLEGGPS